MSSCAQRKKSRLVFRGCLMFPWRLYSASKFRNLLWFSSCSNLEIYWHGFSSCIWHGFLWRKTSKFHAAECSHAMGGRLHVLTSIAWVFLDGLAHPITHSQSFQILWVNRKNSDERAIVIVHFDMYPRRMFPSYNCLDLRMLGSITTRLKKWCFLVPSKVVDPLLWQFDPVGNYLIHLKGII